MPELQEGGAGQPRVGFGRRRQAGGHGEGDAGQEAAAEPESQGAGQAVTTDLNRENAAVVFAGS